MNRILKIIICVLISCSFVNAQSIKRSVISSIGSSSSTTNVILESTLGQPSSIGTVSDGNNYIRQGFQQPLSNSICNNPSVSTVTVFAKTDAGKTRRQ